MLAKELNWPLGTTYVADNFTLAGDACRNSRAGLEELDAAPYRVHSNGLGRIN